MTGGSVAGAPSAKKRKGKKWSRLAGWVLLYLIIFALFLYFIASQSKQVNTYDFPAGKLSITTSQVKYTVGDTVSYTVNNGLSNAVTLIQNCPQEPLHVYKWDTNQWVRIHDTADPTVCSGYQRVVSIPSGGSVNETYKNWPNLFNKPGIYRLVAYADNYPDLPYVDFQVVAPPQQPSVIIKNIYTPIYTPIYIPTPSGGGNGGDD